jgi:uncharacterized OB-fold protein
VVNAGVTHESCVGPAICRIGRQQGQVAPAPFVHGAVRAPLNASESVFMEHTLPAPVANADSLPYWNAARERKLVIRQCKDCKQLHFMPRHLCPACWSDQLEWIEAKGTGRVHSYTIMRRAPLAAFAALGPYVVALIELDEGPRMVANVLGDDALAVKIGDRVQVTFEDRGDGALLPQFQRITA